MDSLKQRYPDARIGLRFTIPARTKASRLAAIAALCMEREAKMDAAQKDLYVAARAGSEAAFRERRPGRART